LTAVKVVTIVRAPSFDLKCSAPEQLRVREVMQGLTSSDNH
jgi:hypothetical protein